MYNWLKNGLILIFTLCLVIVLNWQSLPVFPQSTSTQNQNIQPLPSLEGLPQTAEWQPSKGEWKPIAPHREDRGPIKVVWLRGTPYEMGYQHGQLLHDEIASLGGREIF